ncbi:MAG: DUF4962 domain-containing protein [bacterium]|nr:DUF4962 domain-containing protein [bacterium]
MKFIKKRSDKMLFPFPENGQVIDITPPGLSWMPATKAKNYKVVILTSEHEIIYEKDVGGDPVHLPDLILPPGNYYWDVLAQSEDLKTNIWRGKYEFSVRKDAEKFPWISADILLSHVSKEHPRFLYSKENLTEVKEKIKNERKQAWCRFLENVDIWIDKGINPVYPSYQYIQDAGERKIEYRKYYKELEYIVNEGLINASLAFLISGQKKYSNIAKKILIELASWPTTLDDVTSVCSPFGDEPGLQLAKSMHRAYDWLYVDLSHEERRIILKACEDRAWQTYYRLKNNQDYLTYPGESHAGRLIAYLAEMAIVMNKEIKDSDILLEYSLKALTSTYPHWGGNDGGWAEGINYGVNYNALYLPTFEALRIACQYDMWKLPFFTKLRWFFFYCKSLRSKISPFGDGAENDDIIFKRNLSLLMRFHAQKYNDSYCSWWVKEFDNTNKISGVMSLMFDDDFVAITPTDLPNAKLFSDIGWVAMHSDISKPDHDTLLLFKSSPYGSVSHSHADQNTFAIIKGGKALVIPSGYYGPAYGMPHHSEWTRSTKANNCILINGLGQITRSQDSKGEIIEFYDNKKLSYVLGDAKQAYGDKLIKCDRHILFLKPGLFLILDDLIAKEESTFQWMLHSIENMEISQKHITCKRDDAILDIHLSCPLDLNLSQTDKFDYPYNTGVTKHQYKDVPNHWHMTATTKELAKSTRIGAIMCARDSVDHIEIELLRHRGWFGVKAIDTFGEVTGWLQLNEGATGPAGYGEKILSGSIKVFGIDAEKNLYIK